jgi:hypothetical protein
MLFGIVDHHKAGADVAMTMQTGFIRTSNITLRLDEFSKIRLDKAEPLLNTSFDVSAALTHIAEY